MRLALWALGIVVAFAAPAFAGDVALELAGGRRVDGRILAVGPRRVVIDAAGGARFIERSEILSVTDGGTTVDLSRMASSSDVAAIVVQHLTEAVKEGAGPDTSVRLRRAERTLDLATLRGSEALLRPRDELRTGPYGRVAVLLPSGAKLTARSDAVLRFDDAGDPVLEEGVVHAEHLTGEVSIELPTGRLRALRAVVDVEHLRGRSMIGCYAGLAAELDARDGFQVEIPRNHVAEVSCADGSSPGFVAASPSNATGVSVTTRRPDGSTSRRFSVRPGERVVLLMDMAPPPVGVPAPAPAPIEPRSPDLARREPVAQPAAPGTPRLAPDAGVGRVLGAAGAFVLRRAGLARVVSPDEARSLVLRAADEIGTEETGLDVEVGDARAAIEPGSTVLIDDEGGVARLRLTRGAFAASTANRAAVGVIDGELALAAGKVALRSRSVPGGNRVEARVEKGRAQLSVGKDLMAVLASGDGVAASSESGVIRVEVLTQGGPAPATLSIAGGSVEAGVAAGHRIEVSRQGTALVLSFSNGAALELDDSVRATILDVGLEPEVTPEDGARFKLAAGMRKKLHAARRDGKPDANKPDPRELTRAPEPASRPLEPAEPKGASEPKPAGVETKTLTNGAVLVLKGWGALETKPEAGSFVTVAGQPGSTLSFGPNAHATISRARGNVKIETADGRTVTQEPGSPSIVLRLTDDQRLSIEIQGDRSIMCEPGADVSVFVRADGDVVSLVFGQTYYLRPGQPAIVDPQQGLHLGSYMARQRGR
jgi:hypothetical protein